MRADDSGSSPRLGCFAGSSTRTSSAYTTPLKRATPYISCSSTLFGWRRGAFTGAVRDQIGAIQRAEGGTLFIDEIDKLPLEAQGKLLRLLDERRFSVIGDGRERIANVRFIVASNVNLEEEVRAGRFLVDLYYRINVLPVEVPPLSARRDEIASWAQHQVGLARTRHGSGPDRLTPEADALLRAREWPGNLRQLHSVVLRAWAFAFAGASPKIEAPHVARALRLEASGPSSIAPFRRAAEAFVEASLGETEGGRPPLPLELAEAFTGLVLLAAAERLGGEREAFLHFDLEARTRGGNHLKTWRREMERVEALERALRGASPGDA